MSQKEVGFREANPSDISDLVAFQLAMALETEGLALEPQVCSKGVTAVFERPHLGRYLVAVDPQGKLIGNLLLIPEWSDWRNGQVLWIHSVYILPQYRGQGIYSRFYTYVKEYAQDLEGVRGLRLYVDKRNVKAKAVYEKLGMSNHHYELYEWMVGT